MPSTTQLYEVYAIIDISGNFGSSDFSDIFICFFPEREVPQGRGFLPLRWARSQRTPREMGRSPNVGVCTEEIACPVQFITPSGIPTLISHSVTFVYSFVIVCRTADPNGIDKSTFKQTIPQVKGNSHICQSRSGSNHLSCVSEGCFAKRLFLLGVFVSATYVQDTDVLLGRCA